MDARVRVGRRSAVVAALVAVAVGTGTPAVGQAAARADDGSVDVLVSGAPGRLPSVMEAVASVGEVRTRLPIINGVAARVPRSSMSRLASMDGVRGVTPDAMGHLQSIDPVLGYDVTKDEGSLYYASQVVHATQAWSKGVTGKGVDVALIDSGVVPVKGLTSGNVVSGPDLSFESQSVDLGGLDTFGHGTHMASIIAGRDEVATGSSYASATSHRFTGIAPDARVISLKVASSDGAADVSQVIAAIDWVAQNAHADGLNIKVLNLSYGTDATQNPSVDPLAFAVENAWKAGITVIVSAGNDGTSRQALANPAIDPMVVAVGAADPNNSLSVGDDTIPAFSQHGTSTRAVDVIAPGVHLLGLRNPNSFIDQGNPDARVGSRFFRGSGTSQAAAVVSGEAALYLSKYPNATPDQVKDALRHNATPPASTKALWTGLGVPFADKLIGFTPSSKAPRQARLGTGTGTLEGARGTSHVTDGISLLSGERDIFGVAWEASGWSARSAGSTSWNGGAWNGSLWTGEGFATGGSWAGVPWSSPDWNARTWRDSSWDARTWRDAGWDARTWRDSSWDARTWRDAGWASVGWQRASWSSASWK